MKREKQQQQKPNKLVVSVDRVRRLTRDDMRQAVGGKAQTVPCTHSVGL